MTRQALIEQIRRQVYGSQPSDDANVTTGLVNQLISQGIGIAAKQCYNEAIKLDGVGYVNNSFYSTFKGLPITQDENFLWAITLPKVPVGVGKNEGISTLRIKNSSGDISLPVIWLSENQVTYYQSLPAPTGKILAYTQGNVAYVISSLLLDQFTATATMISGGDNTDITSQLNVPDDYIPIIVEYAVKLLTTSREQVQDLANDGVDVIRTI